MPIDLQRRRDVGRILDDAFRLYREHWRTLLACAAVVVVPVQLLVYGVGLGWLSGGYDASPPLSDSLAGAAAQLLVVTPLVTAMTVHVVVSAGRGRKAGIGESIQAGFDVFTRLLPPIVLAGLGVAFGLLLIVPGLILLVRWAVVPQVVVVEEVRGTAALSRSSKLSVGRGWFVFLVVLVANVLVQVLSLIFTVPLDAAAKAADTMGLAMLGQMLGQLLALPLLALAVTLLYFTLRTEKEAEPPPRMDPPPAPPPDPDDPFEQRRAEGWQPPV